MTAAGEKAAVSEAAPRRGDRLRLSVAATLVLGFGALVVIAVGAVLLITLAAAQVNTRDLLRAAARQHVDAVVASVSVSLAPARAQAEFLARLVGSGEVAPRDDGRLQTVLLGGLAATPQVSGVTFLRTDGTLVRATRTESGFGSGTSRPRKRTDWRKVLAEAERSSGPKWGDILYLPELGDTQITLFAPYQHFTISARRSEGYAFLQGVNLAEISYYTDNDVYTGQFWNIWIAGSIDKMPKYYRGGNGFLPLHFYFTDLQKGYVAAVYGNLDEDPMVDALALVVGSPQAALPTHPDGIHLIIDDTIF